jgi:hypothetical protein
MQHRSNGVRSIARVTVCVTLAVVSARAVHADPITLMWDASSDPNVAGYVVYVGTESGTYAQNVDVANATSFTLQNAVAGQQYCFAVSAYVDGPIVGPKSSAVCGYSNAPPALVNPGNQTSVVGQHTTLQLAGTDPYGDPLTYSAVGLPPGFSVIPSTGFVSGAATVAGTFNVTATVSDGVLSASQSFLWTTQAGLPAAAVLVSPSGSISTNTPGFVWQAVAGATRYRLWVDDASTIDPRIQVDYTPAQAGCSVGSGACQVSPGVALAVGPGTWSIRASSVAGDGPWSGARDFVVPDRTAPVVAITSPAGGTSVTTTNSTISLAGTASDDVQVTQVAWTNSKGGGGTASGTSKWSVASVPLQLGTNAISVTARDAAGNAAHATLTVQRADVRVPTVTIMSPTTAPTHTTTASQVALGGRASSAAGVTRVTWTNSAGGGGTAVGSTEWNVPSVPLQVGSNLITVTAHDAAGQVMLAALTVTRTGVLANAQRPTVVITAPTLADTWETHARVITVAGTTAGPVAMTHVTWVTDRGYSGTATGTSTWNAAGVTLEPGVNVITVTVRDAAGNTASDALVVNYRAQTVAGVLGRSATPALAAPQSASSPSETRTAVARQTAAPPQAAAGGAHVAQPKIATPALERQGGERGGAAPTWVGPVGGGAPLLAGEPPSGPTRTVTPPETVRQPGTSPETAALSEVGTNGALVDEPTITVMAPTAGHVHVTDAATVTLAGSGSENVRVLRWVSDRGGSGIAHGTTVWQIPDIHLETGINVIEVTAESTDGRTSRRRVLIRYEPSDDRE